MFDLGKTSCCALLFGRHELLMETREQLLAIIGCRCTLALDLQSFQRALMSSPIDLVVLCQSLTDAGRSKAVCLAARYRPSARILMLCSPSRWCDPGTDIALLDVMAGPARFLLVARQMLENGTGPA